MSNTDDILKKVCNPQELRIPASYNNMIDKTLSSLPPAGNSMTKLPADKPKYEK